MTYPNIFEVHPDIFENTQPNIFNQGSVVSFPVQLEQELLWTDDYKDLDNEASGENDDVYLETVEQLLSELMSHIYSRTSTDVKTALQLKDMFLEAAFSI